MSRRMLSLVIAVLLLGVGRLSAHATTFYVSKAGADSVTCAQAQNAQTPRRTINAGIACLTGGDTLIIGAGTYDEILSTYAGWAHASGVTRALPSGRSAAQPTIIKSESRGAVTLMSSVKEGQCGSLICLENAQYMAFEDLVLDANWTMGRVFGMNCNNIRIANSEVKNSYDSGFQGTCHNLELLNLDVHHHGVDASGQTICGKPPQGSNFCYQDPPLYQVQWCHGFCHGIYVSGDNILIDGGTWHDNDAWGIHLYPGVTNSTVRNVRAFNNPHTGIGLIIGSNNKVVNNLSYNNGGGIWIKAADTLVEHNTVWGNKGDGVTLSWGGTIVRNNIIYNNGTGLSTDPTGEYKSVVTNLFGSNPGGDIVSDAALQVSGNRMGTNPLLVNPSGGDFHLLKGSAAIGMGRAVAPSVDKDGVPRPSTGAVDVGAYQFVPAGPMPPVPTLPAPGNLQAIVQ